MNQAVAGRKRILVVEDDKAQLLLYRRALEADGYDVETMTSGFGLVNRVAGHGALAPDVLVLDHMLPALTGNASLELLAAK